MNVPFSDSATLPEELVLVKLVSITLTPLESTILATLAATDDRAEITRINFVSLDTFKSQLRILYTKLGIVSHEEDLLVAPQEHLIS